MATTNNSGGEQPQVHSYLIRAPTQAFLRADTTANMRKLYHVGKFSTKNVPPTLISESTEVLPPMHRRSVLETHTKEQDEEVLARFPKNWSTTKARSLLVRSKVRSRQREVAKASGGTVTMQHTVNSGTDQWRLKDPQSDKVYEGQAQVKLDDSMYALFVLRGSEFTYVPTDTVLYRPTIEHATLTTDEAEQKMGEFQHRWMMRQRRSKLAQQLGDFETPLSETASAALVAATEQQSKARFAELSGAAAAPAAATATATGATKSKAVKVKREGSKRRDADVADDDMLVGHREATTAGIKNAGTDAAEVGMDFVEAFDDDEAGDKIAADVPSDVGARDDDDGDDSLDDEVLPDVDDANDDGGGGGGGGSSGVDSKIKRMMERRANEDADDDNDDEYSSDDGSSIDIDDVDDMDADSELTSDGDDEKDEDERMAAAPSSKRSSKKRSRGGDSAATSATTTRGHKRTKTETIALTASLIRQQFKKQKSWTTKGLAARVSELGIDMTDTATRQVFLTLTKNLCYFDKKKHLLLKH